MAADGITTADRNFILQQGLRAPAVVGCSRVSSALLFQPRLIGLVALVGTIWQLPAVFGALAVLLWWCSLIPRLNPFDFTYNHWVGLRPGAPLLEAAPAPRRFAQGLAAAFTTAIGATMSAGFWAAAWALQAIFLLAVAALVLARFCLGSFAYHLLRGRLAFAIDTLPWGRGVVDRDVAKVGWHSRNGVTHD